MLAGLFEPTQGRRALRMKVLLLALAVIVLGVFAAQGSAARPTVEEFDFSFTDTESCPGVTIEIAGSERDIILSETEDQVIVHVNVVQTLSANGKTLIDNDAFNVVIDFAEGLATYRGVVFNIQAPGVGVVLMDVGRLIVNEEGEVIFQGGPHPAFFGDVEGLCSYLADP
jgi:hypothetical protein